MKAPRVLFYVQYLEGIGHVVRANHIARELCKSGCSVTLALGGHPIPGFDFGAAKIFQLPPLHASPTSYSVLLQSDGRPADDDFCERRRDDLLGLYRDLKPDIIITEAYPLGRWAMDFELLPLLEAAASRPDRPLIIASVRDILQMPKAVAKAERSVGIFERYYDALLVHGDPRLARIEESFPPAARFADRTTYTGMIVADRPDGRAADSETFDVIVSAGGGAIAFEVLAAAIDAKPLTGLARARWLALAGPRMPDAEFAELAARAATCNVHFERFRTGLSALLSRARLSIQRAGYNTVGDLLVAGCRGVLVPDADGGQMEQPLRAARLETLGRVSVIDEATLSPATMAEAVERALNMSFGDVEIDLNGAACSARTVMQLWQVHRPS